MNKQKGALQVIFTFFLGLLMTVFIGVGLNTFYPQPPQQEQLQRLYRQQSEIGEPKAAGPNAEQEKLQKRINDLQDESERAMKLWARNNSIILLVLATVVMAASLLLSERLQVISNGLLLGSLFTIVYGTGWSFAGGDSKVRFAVATVALALTLFVGWWKFVRPSGDEASEGTA